jgi:hypothetical protein
LAVNKTIKELANSISRRAAIMDDPQRTKKSLWHHKNMIKLEIKKIQEIINAMEDK